MATVRWQLVVGTAPSVTDAAELTGATQRRFNFALDDSDEATFSLDGRSTEAALIGDLTTDLLAYRNGTLLFRGRLSAAQDDIDADRHQVRFSARSYSEMLSRRILLADTNFYNVDQSTIAWTVINTVQARTNGNLGITRGSGTSTGHNRTMKYAIGTTVLQIITDLGHLEDGFEWEITPNLVFNVYHPSRGENNGVLLAYGSNVRSLTRALEPQYFANMVVVQGSAASTRPRTATAATIATDQRGRWETNVSVADITTTTELTAYANKTLALASRVLASHTVTLENNAWGGPDEFWLGDTVLLVIQTGRLNIYGNYRVSSITVTVDEDGAESVQVTLAEVV